MVLFVITVVVLTAMVIRNVVGARSHMADEPDPSSEARWWQLTILGVSSTAVATLHLLLERSDPSYPHGPISHWLYWWLPSTSMLLFTAWVLVRDRNLVLFLKLLAAAIVASWLTFGWPVFMVFVLGGGGFF